MTTNQEGPRSFARFIESLADGAANSQLSEELFELARKLQNEAQMRDVAVKGELTLKIKLSADPMGMVGVLYDVKRKDPTRPTRVGVMWLTKGGNLSAQNPRQPELPNIRQVKAREEVREVEHDADGVVREG